MSDPNPPLPVQPLAYATPVGYQHNVSLGPWSDGPQLITPTSMVLPSRCVKCNADCEGYWLKKTYYWHTPALFFLIIFPGVLIYAIVAMIVRKSATIEVGLCPVHRKRRFNFIVSAWALAGVAIVLVIVGLGLNGSRSTESLGAMLALLGIPVLIAAIVMGVVASRVALSPTKIDARFAWFKGAGAGFLATLPAAR